MKNFTISIDSYITEFEQILNSTDRLIFSGRFGDGKSYFLNEFKNKTEDENFIITLHPVNYSVASNEDIFEYIKRDIMIKLLQYKEIFEKFSSNIDIKALLKSLVYVSTKVNLDAFKEQYDENRTDIEYFTEQFIKKKGSIYENDSYTQYIKQMIKFVNDKKRKKKNTILIIEDLDRIAPKHLFRILNILSAHIDLENGENNKFGFDKIILVMDYIQTKHIFHHNYGENANYEGYMSKFITTQPFLYDKIIDAAQAKVYEMIGTLVFNDYNKRNWTDTFQNLTRKINNLSVRDCVKITKFDYKTRIISNTCKINERQYSTELPLFKLILLMIEIGLSKKEIIEDFQLFDENDFKEYPLIILPIINDQPTSPIYLRSQNRSKEYIIGIKTNEESVITNIFS